MFLGFYAKKEAEGKKMRRWKKIPSGFPPAFQTEKKKRAKPRKLEDPIHILCFNWLCVNIDGMVYHCPNGLDGGNEVVFIRGRAVPKAAIAWNKLKKMGARAGVLDLTVHWADDSGLGRTAYLEVKSDEGRLSDSQYEFIADLNRCRIPHRLIRSLADCQNAVRELQIPLRNFTACAPMADSGTLRA